MYTVTITQSELYVLIQNMKARIATFQAAIDDFNQNPTPNTNISLETEGLKRAQKRLAELEAL